VAGARGADELDALHARERGGVRPAAEPGSLADGAVVRSGGEPHLVLGGSLRRWSPGGYGPPEPAPGSAALVTPPTLVRVLRAGWEPLDPFLHPAVR
jgi:hypothetical protein